MNLLLLAPCTIRFLEDSRAQLVYMALKLADLFWAVLRKADWWLTEPERLCAARVGTALCHTLGKLGELDMLWLKPKAHALCHIVLYICESDVALNPWKGSTWRDEDMIGKIMKLAKAVHSRSVGTKPIAYYAARLRILLQTC